MRGHQGQITSVDTVTGPYDLIVKIEADDLDQLGRIVTGFIQELPGVEKTTTCLAMAI